MGQNFVEIIKVGDALEDGFKTGKITNVTALRANEKAAKTNYINISKGKEEEVSMVTTTHMRSLSAPQKKYQKQNVNDKKKFPIKTLGRLLK